MSNILTAENTTKILREFTFTSDQVKDLTRQQLFIHTDVQNWFESQLNSWSEWNAIKIVYDEIFHFAIRNVKCVEIYYDSDRKHFYKEIKRILSVAQFKMPWKSETTFYLKDELQMEFVMQELRTYNISHYLVNQSDIAVKWNRKIVLKVFVFSSELNSDQLAELDDIFMEANDDAGLTYITDTVLFLTSWQPPDIMRTSVLTALNGDFLHILGIEDIVALELSNKDHRFSWYDPWLEHDIQRHLEKRLPMLYQNSKIDVYIVKGFQNSSVLCYFIFKYRDRVKKFLVPNTILSKTDVQMLSYLHNIKLVVSEIDAFGVYVDLVSPEEQTICSVSYITSPRDIHNLAEESIDITTKRVRVNRNLDFSLDEWIAQPNHRNQNMRIDIPNRIKCAPEMFIRVLQNATRFRFRNFWIRRIIICFNDFGHNDLDNSILEYLYPDTLPHFTAYTFEFNQISFDVELLLKYFKKWEHALPACIKFIECRTSMHSDAILSRFNSRQRVSKGLTLQFVRMDIHIQLLVHYLENVVNEIVLDGCHIIPVDLISLSPRIDLHRIEFTSMNIDTQIFVTIFGASSLGRVKFDKCEIQLEFKESIKLSASRNLLGTFTNMNLDLHTLVIIMAMFNMIELDHCCLVAGTNFDINLNYEIKTVHVTFKNMPIDIQTFVIFFNKFDRISMVDFDNCCITSGDVVFLSNNNMSLNQITKINFIRMALTPELLYLLAYFSRWCRLHFKYCNFTNDDILNMHRATPKHGNNIIIENDHVIDELIYFQLIGEFFTKNFDILVGNAAKDLDIPFHIFPDIRSRGQLSDWWRTKVKLRSVLVHDGTVKLEYLIDGKVIDLFYELNHMADESDECEVVYD